MNGLLEQVCFKKREEKIYNSISINADRVIFLCENLNLFICHIYNKKGV